MSQKPELHTRVEEGPSTLTVAEAWQVLDSAVRMYTDPAFAEHHILHTPHRVLYQEGQSEMIRHIVGGMNPCVGMTETHLKSVASGVHKVHQAFSGVFSDMLISVQEAIQVIPMDQLIQQVKMHDINDSELGEAANANIKAQIDAMQEQFGFDSGKALIAKPCEQVATLFAVAQALLGGPEQMAKAQAEIMAQIAPEHRKDMNIMLSAQVAGSLSMGLSMRVMDKQFVSACVLGFGEGWNIMQRAAILPFLPMWDDTAHSCFGNVLDNSDRMLAEKLGEPMPEERTDNPEVDEFVRKAEGLNLKPADKPLEADAPENMKATSTLFAGTRTVN